MQIYVFIASKGANFGFAADESGAKLPEDLGPWTRFKSFDLKNGTEHRIGVDIAELLEALHDDGYYVVH